MHGGNAKLCIYCLLCLQDFSQVVIGTPKVIINWASNKSVNVSNGQILVLDECDELFEEVPLEKIRETFLPEHYRYWMFSTTVDRQMEQPMNIKHYFVSCEFPERKNSIIESLSTRLRHGRAIIFCKVSYFVLGN